MTDKVLTEEQKGRVKELCAGVFTDLSKLGFYVEIDETLKDIVKKQLNYCIEFNKHISELYEEEKI